MTNISTVGLPDWLVDVGSGVPVVFLHGTSANHAVWQDVIGALTGACRTIAIDQRGHGLSPLRDGPFSKQRFALDILDFVDKYVSAPCVLVGHSLGGRNAVAAAAAAPDKIRAVLSVDYMPYVEKEVLDELEARVASGFRPFQSLDEIRHYLRERYPHVLPAALERRARYGYVLDADGLYWPRAHAAAMAETVSGLRDDFVDEVRDATVPIAFLCGALSKIVSEAAVQRTRELRPDAAIEMVADVDHYIPETVPERVATAVMAILATQPEVKER